MSDLLSKQISYLDNSEIIQLEHFAEFLLFKRTNNISQSEIDDIPTSELTGLISKSDVFDWLDSPDEDIYSSDDGVPAKW
jgi:hypothetical protein